MHYDELKAELAMLRKQLRRLDKEITFLRNESRHFKRMGFGQDIKQIQAAALEDERLSCLRRIGEIERALRKSPVSSRRASDVAMIPLALVLLGLQAVAPRRATSIARGVAAKRLQLRPAVEVSAGD